LCRVIDQIGQECYLGVIDVDKSGKRFRFIVDNVNFEVDSKFKRGVTIKKEMFHYFASAAIIQETFDELPKQPQGLTKDLTYDNFIPTGNDNAFSERDYSVLIVRVALEHLNFFLFLKVPHRVLLRVSTQRG